MLLRKIRNFAFYLFYVIKSTSCKNYNHILKLIIIENYNIILKKIIEILFYYLLYCNGDMAYNIIIYLTFKSSSKT